VGHYFTYLSLQSMGFSLSILTFFGLSIFGTLLLSYNSSITHQYIQDIVAVQLNPEIVFSAIWLLSSLWGAGIGLFSEINHPSTPWECGCASTWQLAVSHQPRLYYRLSVLSFLPHHHYIRTGHTYLIPLHTINMTPPKPPVQNPVDIPFEMV
jgi:hypothetical protein